MPAPPAVRQVCLVLTTDCNMHCPYCYQNAKGPRTMDAETVKRSLDLLLASRCANLEVVFIGGEPLLEFPLMRMAVQRCSDMRPGHKYVRFRVVTNGLLLSREVVGFLADHDVEIHFSMDGAREAQDLRSPGSFDRLDAVLGMVRDAWPDYFRRSLAVNITLTPRAVPFLARSIDYLLSKEVGAIAVTPVITPTPDWRPSDIATLDEQMASVLRSSVAHFERTGGIPVEIFRNQRESAAERSGRMMCEVASNDSPTVDVDGTVYACGVFAESFQRLETPLLRQAARVMRLGRLTDPEFRSAYDRFPGQVVSLPMFAAKSGKYSSYGRCNECEHFDGCVVCPAAVGHGGSDPDRVPDFYCAWKQVSLKYRSRFPAVPSLPERVRGEPYESEVRKWRGLAERAR